ncbi:MAG TPA: UDP-3-O-(3-hydroxymyristoyl)glucosamine N-acyltransferase [Xanthomonadales bacterium]|nr:UDP-3-O-(3-hydroxymyristoyl)glucosamine N-acyltransferase [Xanthomonadales bacterium]
MLTQPSTHSLSDLAARFGLELRGDGAVLVDGVGTLRSATASQVSFLANPVYQKDLTATRAAVVILKPKDAAACPADCFLTEEPYLAFARMARIFDTFQPVEPGVHASAIVDATARLGPAVAIGPRVVIGPRCEIGAACSIGPGTVIEADCRLGSGCRLYANVSLGQRVRLGDRVIIHPGAVLGGDGFGIAFAGDHWEKVPQLGGVTIGDDCEIGANTTIDRGAIEDTVLEEDIKVDNLVQIAHNVHIGAHSAIAAMTGIAGSARIGRYCLLGGRSSISGHVEIADRVTVGADSVAYYSIEEPGTTWSALMPAQPLNTWQRNLSHLRKLDELARRLVAMEKKLGKSRDND